MMHQMNQRSGEHALILDALRNAYAEFHDPNGIALSRNRVLRSRPDRGSTPITRNKVCIKPGMLHSLARAANFTTWSDTRSLPNTYVHTRVR